MYSQETVLQLVDLIYSAAGDPAGWAAFVKRLASLMRGNIATIHHQRYAENQSNFAASWNMDPAAIQTYADHYGSLNVWFTTRPELHVQGKVYTSQMLCPEDLLLRTEFYNDWLKPQEMHQGVGATIFKSGEVSSIVSIFRPPNADAYGPDDLLLFKTLLPHLRRAFQLHTRIQGLERKGEAAEEVLDELHRGVVLLDAKGNILLVNRAATALFASEKALRLTPRGLVAAITSENRRLNALIQGAITTGSGNGLHSGGAMTISRNGFHRPLQVVVTPLRTKTIHLGKHVPVVAIFISDPDQKSASDSSVFSQLYGLTPSEAHLAHILACGESLKDASEQLGVAQSTVRSQLKTIFAKTNTNRQSDLARLLLLAPSRFAQTQTTTTPRRT